MWKVITILGIIAMFLLVVPIVSAQTVLKLAQSEIISDTWTKANDVGANFDTENRFGMANSAATETRAYGQINLQNIPTGAIITNVTGYFFSVNFEASMTGNFHTVFSNSSGLLDSGGITWNNDNVCGSVASTVNGSTCNTTSTDVVVGTNATLFQVDLLSATKHSISQGSDNLTFMFTTATGGAGNTNAFATVDRAEVEQRWFVNVTYTSGLQACDLSGFPAINFTIIDELNGSRIRGAFTANFNYNGTPPSVSTTLTDTNRDNFSICVFPNGETFVGDYDISYSAPGFQARSFIDSNTIFDNVTDLINLELLADSVGIFATFSVIDSIQNAINGVEVSMKITSSNTTIEVRKTDDAGIAAFFVNPDTTYTFTFIKSGFTTATSNLRITNTNIITVTLNKPTTEQDKSFATGINYFFLPTNQVLNNNTDFTFVANLTSSFWNITACTLTLKNTTTVLSKSSTTFNGSECIISIVLNTGNQSIIISSLSYRLNNTANNTVFVQYTVLWTYVGNFSLSNFIDDVKAFSEAGFGDTTRFLIALMIIFGITAFMSMESANFRETEVLVPLVLMLILFFSFIGWMNVNLDTIPEIRGLPVGWLKQYITFIISVLIGGSVIVNKFK